MTITFPRDMLSIGFASQAFELQHQVTTAPERGGRIVSVELGPARWVGSWTTNRLGRAEFNALRSWLSSLRSASRLFYGADRLHRWPLAYPAGFTGLNRAGGGAFDGTATGWSVDGTRSTLTLTGLPVGFSVAAGDYVGMTWSTTKRALVRSLETVLANGSGTAVFDIEPSMPLVVAGGAVASFAAPTCLMRLEPGATDASASADRTGAISFRAIQHLEA